MLSVPTTARIVVIGGGPSGSTAARDKTALASLDGEERERAGARQPTDVPALKADPAAVVLR